MKTIYDVDYFIKKFEAIPEEKWCTENFHFGEMSCAQGHCGMNISNANMVWMKPIHLIPDELKEAKHLVMLFQSTTNPTRIASINNGFDKDYNQHTPKQRVLAALYDIKAKQQPEVKTVPEKVVYVTVDSDVRTLQKKELSLN